MCGQHKAQRLFQNRGSAAAAAPHLPLGHRPGTLIPSPPRRPAGAQRPPAPKFLRELIPAAAPGPAARARRSEAGAAPEKERRRLPTRRLLPAPPHQRDPPPDHARPGIT
ncbi:unnamed protein product [Rangifer tarandus platyrhynchus]|uniref:Uncharacterized protein n=1 Tax=Rangifer tarandus platyrhynchus TaxID=3082113 RepID=A0AC59YBQ3_RANTA